MKKPFGIKLITVLTFLAPLSIYLNDPQVSALSLVATAIVTTPIAIGLHFLRREARIAMLVVLYLETALGLLVTIEVPQAHIVLGTLTAVYALCVLYMHRPSIRLLFNPDSYDPYGHWKGRNR